jgi:hypothetical protein
MPRATPRPDTATSFGFEAVRVARRIDARGDRRFPNGQANTASSVDSIRNSRKAKGIWNRRETSSADSRIWQIGRRLPAAGETDHQA